ncbi:helix-turn-helix domain-containing protein [Winkia neuii]|uniref:helix-turn-helix domain-containing protein n=1 Tax=Winkia neuii TaxID=33007 RepID=UPI002556F7F2|nr:helix-turn-helix domain-containing protein [Winkia neuii]MDK8100699.1 helix-turn-helix domain-containing protein [Winkia neuii]
MELHKQSLLFATYVSKELKATLVRYDASMAEAAKATKHSRTAVTNWLSGRNQLPLRVLYEICEYVGEDPDRVVQNAYERLQRELGETAQRSNVADLFPGGREIPEPNYGRSAASTPGYDPDLESEQ